MLNTAGRVPKIEVSSQRKVKFGLPGKFQYHAPLRGGHSRNLTDLRTITVHVNMNQIAWKLLRFPFAQKLITTRRQDTTHSCLAPPSPETEKRESDSCSPELRANPWGRPFRHDG
jgi:hypothetical protein